MMTASKAVCAVLMDPVARVMEQLAVIIDTGLASPPPFWAGREQQHLDKNLQVWASNQRGYRVPI